MNAQQRRKALRARTHYRCDFCQHVRPFPYVGLTGCGWCIPRWWASAPERDRDFQSFARTPMMGTR